MGSFHHLVYEAEAVAPIIEVLPAQLMTHVNTN